MKKGLMIREMRIGDLDRVLEIERLTQEAPWSPEIFRRCIEMTYKSYVVEENQNIVGFIILSFEVGEGHILNLAVHPEFQKKGYGQGLLTTILDVATSAGAQIIYLEVRPSNLKAIALYNKLEFNQVTTRKNYYPSKVGQREDALIFAKVLGDFTFSPRVEPKTD